MDQDADKPDERAVNPAKEGAGLILDLDALAAEFDAKVRDGNPRDNSTGLDEDADETVRLAENALVDDGEHEDDSSQLAALQSGTLTDYEVSDDEPPSPQAVVAVATPSLIQRIARLIFGGFR